MLAMPEWLATVVTGVGCSLLGYLLGVRRERRAEKRAEFAERRARRAEKRDVGRLEREREQTADQEDYREFLDEVDSHFEDGGRFRWNPRTACWRNGRSMMDSSTPNGGRRS